MGSWHEERIIWQNAVQIYFLHGIHSELVKLNERTEHMATVSDQAVTDIIGAIDNAVKTIKEAIVELAANPHSLDVSPALETAATALNTASDALKGVEAPAPPTDTSVPTVGDKVKNIQTGDTFTVAAVDASSVTLTAADGTESTVDLTAWRDNFESA